MSTEAAILFAQMSADVGLNRLAADAAGYAAIMKCRGLMEEKTKAAAGRVVKWNGYRLMASFPTPEAAAEAAMEMQAAIEGEAFGDGAHIRLGIGLHYGAVLERPEGGILDVFGDAVNVAARLTQVATERQIFTGEDTVKRLPPMLKASTRHITAVQLKGKAEPMPVYELIWQQSAEMTALAGQRSIVRPKETQLRLVTHAGELVLSAARPALSMGRDAGADLVVRERTASRAHGKIERRLDKFVLTDHSANGTFVTLEGLNEIVLRREEFTLRGHGWISFGQSRGTASDVVEFFAE